LFILAINVLHLHCVTKNDTDVAHYNFNAHQPIVVFWCRDVAERLCYQLV